MNVETLNQLEKAWGEAYLWEVSPLHGLSQEDKKQFLESLLENRDLHKIDQLYRCGLPQSHSFDTCQSTQVFIKHLHKLLGYDANNVDVLLEEYMDWNMLCNCKCKANFVLFDALCANCTDKSLVETIVRGNGTGFWVHILIDHAVQRRLKLPTVIDDTPILRFILEQTPRSSSTLFERLAALDYYVLELDMPLRYMQYNPKTVAWLLLRHLPTNLYPFSDFSLSNLCHLEGTMPHIAVLTLIGGFRPDDDGLSSLLRSADIAPPFCRSLMMKYVKDSLDQGLNKLTSMVFWCSSEYGPSNDMMEMVAAHMECRSFALNIALLFLEMPWKYPPPSPLSLNIDYWVLYFHQQGYYERTTKACIKSHMQNYTSKWNKPYPVDPRVMEHLFLFERTSAVVVSGVSDRALPPFGEMTTSILEVKGCQRPFHVYLDHLIDKSRLLTSIVNHQKTFPPPPGLDDGIMKLELDIPEEVRDIQSSFKAWICHCYTGLMQRDTTVDDIVDLYSLASYMGDDDCMQHCVDWLSRQFLIDFKNHLSCKEGTCFVCTNWKQSRET